MLQHPPILNLILRVHGMKGMIVTFFRNLTKIVKDSREEVDIRQKNSVAVFKMPVQKGYQTSIVLLFRSVVKGQDDKV